MFLESRLFYALILFSFDKVAIWHLVYLFIMRRVEMLCQLLSYLRKKMKLFIFIETYFSFFYFLKYLLVYIVIRAVRFYRYGWVGEFLECRVIFITSFQED